MARGGPPSCRTASARVSSLRPVMTTRSPRCTSAEAIASPIPRLAAVTMATLPGPVSSATRSSGDVDDLTGHEARALADQERHGVRHVLGPAHPPYRGLLRGRLLERLEVHADAGGGG